MDHKNNYLITIAIPTFQRDKLLFDTLNSIELQTTNYKYEIFVLDNACNNQLESELKNNYENKNINYFPIPELGLHNCRNVAALKSNGDIIVYIDDDVIVSQHWLNGICRPFTEYDVAGVGGKILPKWEGQKPVWLDSINESYFSLLDLGDTNKEMKLPETPYGCNMAYKRSVVMELGGFSPDAIGNSLIEWKRGDGESGFARKVYDRGMRIIYSADGYLYHRIPPERMTKEYVRKRTVKSAISLSYMDMRTNKYSSVILIKIAFKNLYLLLKTIIKNTGRIIKNKTDINFQISIVYYFITFIYQARLSIDSRLRRWVLQDNYFYINK